MNLTALLLLVTTPTPSPVPVPPSFGPASGPLMEAPGTPNPSDLDWWWQYGLDGVVGAVLAVAGAWFVFWRTIQHERKRAAFAEARTTVANLQTYAIRSTTTPDMDAGSSQLAVMTWLTGVLNQSIGALGTVAPAAPRLGEDLASFIVEVRTLMPDPGATEGWEPDRARGREMASALTGKLVDWQVDPKKYEAGPPVDWSATIEWIRAEKARRRAARTASPPPVDGRSLPTKPPPAYPPPPVN